MHALIICYSLSTHSDVTDADLDHRIIMEVWDWDRLTANDFIGGLSIRVGEILDFTKEKPFSSWYKLLDEKRTKSSNERILADDEAVKVRGKGGGERGAMFNITF